MPRMYLGDQLVGAGYLGASPLAGFSPETNFQRAGALGLPGAVGRTSTSPLKRPDTDQLPAGNALDGATGAYIRVNADTITPDGYVDWDFTDHIAVSGDPIAMSLYSLGPRSIDISQSVFGEAGQPGGGVSGYLDIRDLASVVNITNVDFYGTGSFSTAGSMFSAEGDWTVDRFVMRNFGQDGFKSSGDVAISNMFIDDPMNLPTPMADIPVYSDTATFVVDDIVRVTNSLTSDLLRALRTTTGDGVTDATAFEDYDPHMDLTNPHAGELVVSGAYVRISPVAYQRIAGATQTVRGIQNSRRSDRLGPITIRGWRSDPWPGYFPLAFGDQNQWSATAGANTWNKGDFTRVGVRMFESLIDSNQGNDPMLDDGTNWRECLYNGIEGPFAIHDSYMGAGRAGDYYYGTQANQPQYPWIIDGLRNHDDTADVRPRDYAIVKNTGPAVFGDITHYPVNDFSATGNSFVVTPSAYDTLQLPGDATVQACVLQIRSALVGYITEARTAHLFPDMDEVWEIIDEGNGEWRFEATGVNSQLLLGEGRIVGGEGAFVAEVVTPPATFLLVDDGDDPVLSNIDVLALRVSVNDGATQTLTEAGLTLSAHPTDGTKARLVGATVGDDYKFSYEADLSFGSPYASPHEGEGTANDLINNLLSRPLTGPTITTAFAPAVAVVSTPRNSPVGVVA